MNRPTVDAVGVSPLDFTLLRTRRNRPFYVPKHLRDLPRTQTRAVVELARSINWSPPYRPYDLAVPADRCLVYEKVMTEGLPEDIAKYIDAASLDEVWDQLVLSHEICAAWEPLVRHRRGQVA